MLAGSVAVAVAAGLLAGSVTADDQPSPSPQEASRPAVPARSASFTAALGNSLDRLAAEREELLERLRAADTPNDQMAAARKLETAHRRIANSLASAPPPADLARAKRSVVLGLRGVAASYARLSRGAAAAEPARYAAARTRVQRAEQRLRERLAAVTA